MTSDMHLISAEPLMVESRLRGRFHLICATVVLREPPNIVGRIRMCQATIRIQAATNQLKSSTDIQLAFPLHLETDGGTNIR